MTKQERLTEPQGRPKNNPGGSGEAKPKGQVPTMSKPPPPPPKKKS